MQITAQSKVAEIAAGNPATIKVFQKHGIDFCCRGGVPLAEACEQRGLDPETLLGDLRTVQPAGEEDSTNWSNRSLAELVAHIQERYHKPLNLELARLEKMLTKVFEKHGERLPGTLAPLRETFDKLHRDLVDHMGREDAVLFPLIVELESTHESVRPTSMGWIRQVVGRMTAEHEVAGEALSVMRIITGGYVAPSWACPTFLGLYHGLAELEREMHIHVHLENAILFPRASGQGVCSIG